MFTLKVKNHRNNTLELTGNPCYTVYKVDGLTPPAATVNSSANTTIDGSTINSVRVENRNIVIYLTIEGEVEKNRINLYKYFPLKKNVTIYYKNDSRDVYTNGVVDTIECDLFANKQVAQISIICPNPYFKSVENNITEFSTINSAFEFPFDIDEGGMVFSDITPPARKTVINEGDIETGVIINLFASGNVSMPIIYDVIKQTFIALDVDMVNGDKIEINTNVGEKKITLTRDGVTTKILGNMRPNSTWFTLEAGDNVFTYECADGIENLQVTFTNRVLYGGV